jgi:integrase/recombinase XerD
MIDKMRVTGPLASYAAGFGAELTRLGYAPRSATALIGLMGQLSRWLQTQGLDAAGFTEDVAEGFLRARGDAGSWRPTGKTLRGLLGYLRELGVTPRPVAPVARTSLDELLERYRRYLVDERGLVEGTIDNYLHSARLFLSGRIGGEGRVELEGLRVADVTAFVTRECPGRGVGAARNLASALRSLLRFAYLEGLTAAPLAQAVPGAAGWSGSALPRALDPGQAERLLAGCDRRRATGRRDYAILVLLLRLGLRAGEVAALRVGDLDWRAGEIVVRGKGGRQERLPLPVDVGEALVGYLRQGRPSTAQRAVFLRAYAPLRGLSASGISEVARAAGERAGLPEATGAHRLRHTAATEMLRAGAGLSEVAQVLRHRSTATTALYAKVDHAALAALVVAWPAGAR